MLFKMAFRNILRQKRRSILTILMMVCGYVLLSFAIAFETGTYDEIISMFTQQYVGHVQIHSKEYAKATSLYDTLEDKNSLVKILEKNRYVRSFSLRLLSGALASFGSKTFGAEIIGVDFEAENKTSGINRRLEQGSMPQEEAHAKQVVIGNKLSRVLGIGLGDELILISQGADGSIANDLFRIVGILQGKEQTRDDYRVYMGLASAQEFYSLYEQAHEVAISLHDMDLIEKFEKEMISQTSNVVRSWKIIEKDFYKAMQADKKGSDVSFFIIMFIVGMGVLNTVLMATLERTREFGVLKAIGTTPLNIVLLIILETAIIAMISIVVGSLLATFLNLHFETNGISLGESFTYGGVSFHEMHAHVNFKSYWIPTSIVMITALIVALYPGYKASRISPVEAMREY